jgi:hypothetical protein
VEQFVQAVRLRWQRELLWSSISHGLLAGGVAGAVVALLRVVAGLRFSSAWIALIVVLPVVVNAVRTSMRLPSRLMAARELDRRLQLQDRAATALQFLTLRSNMTGLHRLQVDDANARVQRHEPAAVVPIRIPRTWKPALMATLVAALLATITNHPQSLEATSVADEAVVAQAERAAELVSELVELSEVTPDPKLDQLIQELRQLSAPMENPGTSPREALAALSEMDAALQAMQQQLAAASGESTLKEIGAALSLAAPLAEAGQALARGDFDRAAEVLDRAELPAVDRATRTAMTERLQEAAKPDKQQQTGRLQDASQKLSEGLAAQQADKFREGAQELSSASRQQSRNNQLAKELARQSRQLNDAKSALESELRSRSQAQRTGQSGNTSAGNARKGGKQAGRGSAARSPSKDGTRNASGDMKLKGDDSGEGDSETETTASSESKAVDVQRGYQPSPGRVQALDEAALESESIPLGHRQTIRRYFELIRPATEAAESAQRGATETDDRSAEDERP